MKLKIGDKSFGNVPDEKLQDYKPKPRIRHHIVEELIIAGICNLIRDYKNKPGAREQFKRALGIIDEQKRANGDRDGSKQRRKDPRRDDK